VEGVASPRSGTTRTAPLRPRRGTAAADALADAVSTPSFRSGRGRPRRRGRRVTRIVRRIELWSVLKIALVFNTIMLGVVLGSVALLWGLANTTGLVDDLEGFLRDAGFEDFRFQGERMFEQVAFIGAVGALAATVFMVLATALLNLISEITGGIRFVVIEEIVEPSAPAAAPTPLALPTVPSTPSVAPPAPAPASDADAFARPAAPAPATPSAADATGDDEPAVSTAKAAMTTSKTSGSSGGASGGTRKPRRPGPSTRSSGTARSTSRPKPKAKPTPKPAAKAAEAEADPQPTDTSDRPYDAEADETDS
jgi:hypothetical protein